MIRYVNLNCMLFKNGSYVFSEINIKDNIYSYVK